MEKVIQSKNQFSQVITNSINEDSMMGVISKIQKAHQVQASWEKTEFSQRCEYITKIIEQIELNKNQIAQSESVEQGLTIDFQLQKNILPLTDYAKQIIDKVQSEIEPTNGQLPTGLTLIMTTWQLQFRMIGERLLPALLAGNVVLVKVSSQSIGSGLFWQQILSRAGVPDNVVQFLYFQSDELLKILSGHPGIKAISFVGQNSTAKKIASAALPSMKKLQFSLGTKTSALILSVDRIDQWISDLAESIMMGSGQLAWNVHRIYVLDQHRDLVIEKLKAIWNQYGPLTDENQNLGYSPLINQDSIAQYQSYLQTIRQESGKLVIQSVESFDHSSSMNREVIESEQLRESTNNHSCFCSPVIVLDLPNCSELQQEELHLPIVLMTSVKYPYEMVKWINNNHYGHHCVIYGDYEKIIKFGQQCEVGHVMGNSWLHYLKPISGQKASAYGLQDFRWNGDFYSKAKSFLIKSF